MRVVDGLLLAAVPIAVGITVLRYRLYDLELTDSSFPEKGETAATTQPLVRNQVRTTEAARLARANIIANCCKTILC
jgi:hypothetical protein